MDKSEKIDELASKVKGAFTQHQKLINELISLDEMEAERVLAWEQEQGDGA